MLTHIISLEQPYFYNMLIRSEYIGVVY